MTIFREVEVEVEISERDVSVMEDEELDELLRLIQAEKASRQQEQARIDAHCQRLDNIDMDDLTARLSEIL